jgi:mannose-6-phosphate isomerase-like protein (cupin superfamily)
VPFAVINGAAVANLEKGGAEEVLEVAPGQAVVIPRGVWHRVLLNEPSRLVHITAGPGGQHRALPSHTPA